MVEYELCRKGVVAFGKGPLALGRGSEVLELESPPFAAELLWKIQVQRSMLMK